MTSVLILLLDNRAHHEHLTIRFNSIKRFAHHGVHQAQVVPDEARDGRNVELSSVHGVLDCPKEDLILLTQHAY